MLLNKRNRNLGSNLTGLALIGLPTTGPWKEGKIGITSLFTSFHKMKRRIHESLRFENLFWSLKTQLGSSTYAKLIVLS